MATIVNDRDTLLQSASSRISKVSSDFISVSSTATSFVRSKANFASDSVVTPESIKITFKLNGRLYGTPVITYTGVSTVSIVYVDQYTTEVTVLGDNIPDNSNSCTVTATLSLWGNTYTTAATLSDSKLAPKAVNSTSIAFSTQGTFLKISWEPGTDLDLAGYEVRTSNSGWGVDTDYVYNGNAANCFTLPGALGESTTYYIKAYDRSGRYSTVASKSYTLAAPAAPTGVSATWSSTSNTASTVTLEWDNTTPPYGFQEYKVEIALPGGSTITKITNTPQLIISVSWTGTATAKVYVKDRLGNYSAASDAYSIDKLAPPAVTAPITITEVGKKLGLNWEQPTRSSLPITSYEVRTSNTGWGNSSYLWRGLVSECQVSAPALGSETSYYVKAIDSDNVYSSTATATKYTRTAPPSVASNSVSHTFTTSDTGTALVTISWSAPTNTTFAIASYSVSLAKPDGTSVTSTLYADTWTVSADWEGEATFTVVTTDVLGAQSTQTSYAIQKVPVSISAVTFTTKPVSDTLEVSWTVPSNIRTGITWTRSGTTISVTDPGHGYVKGVKILVSASSSTAALPNGTYTIVSVSGSVYTITGLNAGATSGTLTNNTKFSLPVSEYELRASDNSTVIYKGKALRTYIPKSYLGTTTSWYLYAIDSAGKYSQSGKIGSTELSLPSVATALVTSAISTTTSTLTISWAAPSIGSTQFAVQKYRIVLSRPNLPNVETITTNTSWAYKPDWAGNTATVSVYSIDVVGFESATAASLNITVKKPKAPNAATFATSSKSIVVSWSAVVPDADMLPVAGYEIRDVNDEDNLWGTTSGGLIWKGNGTSATFSATNYVASSEPYDFYMRTYDTQGNYSTTTVSYFNVNTPESILASDISYTYDNGESGGTTVNVQWASPASTYAVDYYQVTLIRNGKTNKIIKTSSNSYRFDVDWQGDATVTVVAYDVLGNGSPASTAKTLTKEPPGAPGFVSVVTRDTTLRLTWSAATAGSIGIAGYEVRELNSDWGTSSNYVYRGNSLYTDIGNTSVGSKTWYVKAYDLFGQYSATALTTTAYTVSAPGQPSTPTAKYSDTDSSAALVTFSWSSAKNTFNIANYRLTLTKPGNIVEIVTIDSTSWTTEANWVGDATLAIVAYDIAGNASTTRTTTFTKSPPSAPTAGTSSVDTSGIVFKWSPGAVSTLGIYGYEIRDENTAAVIWKGTATQYTKTSGIVEGNNSVRVFAYDTDGNYSTTGTLLSYTVGKPGTPTFPAEAITWSTSLTNAAVTVKWNTPSSIFGIQYYNVEFVTTTPNLPERTITSRRNTTDWEIPAYWVGTGTLKVTAVDNMGVASGVATTSITRSRPSIPGTMTLISESGTFIELDWPDNTITSLPVSGYVLRTDIQNSSPDLKTGLLFKGDSSKASIDLQQLEVPASTDINFYLYAYDTGGVFSSQPSQYTYKGAAPVNTEALEAKFEDTNLTSATVVLTWKDTFPTFGLKHYEILGSLVVTATTSAGSNLVVVSSTKGIKPGDTVSSTKIPSTKIVSSIISDTELYLEDSTGITTGTATATFTNTTYTNSTTTTQPADWLGSKTFTVKTVNVLGWKSSGTSASLTKNLPSQASNFRAQVIDNTVLLYWDLPLVTSLPIAHALIKKGSAWTTGEVIGEKSGSFTTITELQGGSYTYWLAIVDTDGNESAPVSLTTTVSAPPDYIFNAEYSSTFSGTKSNAKIETYINSSALILPVNLTETFQTHFTASGRNWTSPNAQVSAGYPVYIQPGLSTGYYEESIDYGTTLGASQVSVSLNGSVVIGTAQVVVTISTSANNSTWVVYENSTNAFATNFRYIKVKLTVTQITPGAIYKLNSMLIRLDAKQKTDSGTTSMSLGGARAQYNISPDHVTLWKNNLLPASGFSPIGGVGANIIALKNGPAKQINAAASQELVWVCLDTDVSSGTDVASDADGGWDGSYFDVDPTYPHIFALFVKTLTNNGTTYFGLHTNGTGDTLNLNGTSNTDPYFWSGDLPALNTWYLLVGYVQPNSGSASSGISALYNLDGSKVSGAAVSEFKFPTNASSAMLRAYHYSNPTGSGAEVQYMARPVVLQCTNSADAQNKVDYLLQCATKYGAYVVPNNAFIDITSITVTPQALPQQGTNLKTPLVDFYDIPSPERFNVFVYNSSGIPDSGTVSWTVRGY